MAEEASSEVARQIRVLIVDDRAELRQAYRNLLYFEDNLAIVGEASNATG